MTHPIAAREAARHLRIPRAIFATILATLALAVPAAAQLAAPGDVYYDIHLDQVFKYGPFAADFETWENRDFAGTVPDFVAAHDSSLATGVAAATVAVTTSGGSFRGELAADLDLSARTGAFCDVSCLMRVDVYVKGPTGTPYRVVTTCSGDLFASRLGGLPGSLQPVNGAASANLADSTALIDQTGSVAIPVYEPQVFAGHTTTAITIGVDTFSLAGAFTFNASARVTQAICILGCMTGPADFAAHSSGLAAMDVYLCEDAPGGAGLLCSEVPTAAPGTPDLDARLRLEARPNPFNPRTELAFTGLPGRSCAVEIFDARGALVRRLYGGMATGGEQHVTWDASRAPSGLYLARVRSGGASVQRKLMLLR